MKAVILAAMAVAALIAAAVIAVPSSNDDRPSKLLQFRIDTR